MRSIKEEPYLIFGGTHQTFNFKISEILLLELDDINNSILLHTNICKDNNNRIYKINYNKININNINNIDLSYNEINKCRILDFKLLSNSLASKKIFKLKSTLLTKIEDEIK